MTRLNQLERARADYNGEQWAMSAKGIVALQSRLSAAEEVAQLWLDRHKTAESKLAAVMKLGNEPSEEMRMATFGMFDDASDEEIFKAMFAKLVEQSKGQAK